MEALRLVIWETHWPSPSAQELGGTAEPLFTPESRISPGNTGSAFLLIPSPSLNTDIHFFVVVVAYKNFILFYFYFYYLSFVLLGPHLRPMEVPRLGVESEL